MLKSFILFTLLNSLICSAQPNRYEITEEERFARINLVLKGMHNTGSDTLSTLEAQKKQQIRIQQKILATLTEVEKSYAIVKRMRAGFFKRIWLWIVRKFRGSAEKRIEKKHIKRMNMFLNKVTKQEQENLIKLRAMCPDNPDDKQKVESEIDKTLILLSNLKKLSYQINVELDTHLMILDEAIATTDKTDKKISETEALMREIH